MDIYYFTFSPLGESAGSTGQGKERSLVLATNNKPARENMQQGNGLINNLNRPSPPP